MLEYQKSNLLWLNARSDLKSYYQLFYTVKVIEADRLLSFTVGFPSKTQFSKNWKKDKLFIIINSIIKSITWKLFA